MAARCAVHSEVRPSGDELLPCQPHTHVIVCAWCLYSAMTCFRGSLTGVAAGRGGRIVPLDTMGVTSQGLAFGRRRPVRVGHRPGEERNATIAWTRILP